MLIRKEAYIIKALKFESKYKYLNEKLRTFKIIHMKHLTNSKCCVNINYCHYCYHHWHSGEIVTVICTYNMSLSQDFNICWKDI